MAVRQVMGSTQTVGDIFTPQNGWNIFIAHNFTTTDVIELLARVPGQTEWVTARLHSTNKDYHIDANTHYFEMRMSRDLEYQFQSDGDNTGHTIYLVDGE